MKSRASLGAAIIAAGLAIVGFVGSCSNGSASKQDSGNSKHVATVANFDELKQLIETSEEKLLVFDLYADWCGPCKVLAPIYSSLADTHHERASFFRVNVDKSPDIAGAFGVRGIPYVVFVKKGQAVTAMTGVNPKESYEKIILACGNDESVEDCLTKLKG